jgi:pimeloyl-ACP methyl ester carboxylesterase
MGRGVMAREVRPDAKRSFVVVDDGVLACATEGEGASVLLIPDLGVDARVFRRQLDDLCRDARVITYDQRGVGRSTAAASATLTIAQLADDAAIVLRHAESAPAVVVGAGLGAAVAVELVLRHGDAVSALVLLAPAFAADARLETVLRSWCAGDGMDVEARVRAMVPRLLGPASLADARTCEPFAATLRETTIDVPQSTLRAQVAALLRWLGTRAGRLARLDVPVVVAVGAKDVLTPPAHAQALARELPHPHVEILAAAGHALMIERADSVNRLIRDVVAQVRTERTLP